MGLTMLVCKQALLSVFVLMLCMLPMVMPATSVVMSARMAIRLATVVVSMIMAVCMPGTWDLGVAMTAWAGMFAGRRAV